MPRPSQKLIAYLNTELKLSDSAIKLGLKQSEIEQAPLPIVLWSLGLLSIEQYHSLIHFELESKIEP